MAAVARRILTQCGDVANLVVDMTCTSAVSYDVPTNLSKPTVDGILRCPAEEPHMGLQRANHSFGTLAYKAGCLRNLDLGDVSRELKSALSNYTLILGCGEFRT